LDVASGRRAADQRVAVGRGIDRLGRISQIAVDQNFATKTIPWIAFAAMVLALVANLYPVPDGVYGKLPYVYLFYLAVVLLFFVLRSRRKAAVPEGP
jgi:hypothetical protein